MLKEINLEYSLEGLLLKLKLQYFHHLMRRVNSLERPWFWERLKAEGERDDRGWNGYAASPVRWTCIWANSGRKWGSEEPGLLQSWELQRVGHDLATKQQQQFLTIVWTDIIIFYTVGDMGMNELWCPSYI